MSTSKKKRDETKDPFGGMNVVEALLGGAHRPAVTPQTPTDADVVLEAEQKRAKLRKMKPWQRKKYERDKRRVKFKFTVYVPESLIQVVDEIASVNAVSPSSAAMWLIGEGLRLWREGKVSPPQTTHSRNLRAKYSLVIPAEWEGKRVRRTFELALFGDEIYAMAQKYACGRSDAVAWLMSVGASAYRMGVRPEREPSDSIRYPFKLRVAGNYEGIKGSLPKAEKPAPEAVLKHFMEGK